MGVIGGPAKSAPSVVRHNRAVGFPTVDGKTGYVPSPPVGASFILRVLPCGLSRNVIDIRAKHAAKIGRFRDADTMDS